MRPSAFKTILAATLPTVLALAGCGGSGALSGSGAALAVSAATSSIDTNCTGCNALNAKGAPVQRFWANQSGVSWSVAGGDPVGGAGAIDASGQYTPPSFLTTDKTVVAVTATTADGQQSSTALSITPGFLQPLTPENVALGAGGSVTITGYLAIAGGSTTIHFALANTPTGLSGGQGSLSATRCQRDPNSYTTCTVVYTAPATITTTDVTYVVATAGSGSSKTAAAILLNTAGVTSNPATHQARLPMAIQLGTSGGNNHDYDARNGKIADCCGGTLGALVQDQNGQRYLLSNNHVLARSDHAAVGDAIVQPGLIDNSCTPYGDGPGTTPVATLSAWLPLAASRTNADAALALAASGAVDPAGEILELGARQADGTLGAAALGVSSTGGKGESAWLGMSVAKSGRTTGLTCAAVSALALDVAVDYYHDCAETKPYLTKTFTNQISISGKRFSDAGDSGALVVDAADAEPVGLYFAGGVDSSGVSHAVASPAAEVLRELGAQTGNSYSFVGGADHSVSCLNYGEGSAAHTHALSASEQSRLEEGLAAARTLVSPRAGVLGVAAGASADHPGEAAVIVYVDESMNVSAPAAIGGVRTVVIPTSARAAAANSAPTTAPATALSSAALAQAVTVKQQQAAALMKQQPAFFGVGAGQSLDNPKEAALIVFVDRKQLPASLPQSVGGVRTRYVVMDRLHVTRSYAEKIPARSRCTAHRTADIFQRLRNEIWPLR